MKKTIKILAVILTLTMVFTLIVSNMVWADSSNGKGNDKKEFNNSKLNDKNQWNNDNMEEDLGDLKSKEKAWKLRKKQLEAIKDEIELQKDTLENSKDELENKYEEALENGDNELAEQLYGELVDLKDELSTLKLEMTMKRREMKEVVKSKYTEEEILQLEKVGEELENSNEDITAMPVESIILKGREAKFDTPPVIKSGRMLIPVRALSEAFGADVSWNGEERSVTITKGDTVILLKLDSVKVYLNDEEIELDVPAKNINGRTVVPIRFIAESLGLKVKWDEDTSSVEIEDEDTTDEDTDEEDENTTDEDTDEEEDEDTTDEDTDVEEDENTTEEDTDVEEDENATEEDTDVEEDENATEEDTDAENGTETPTTSSDIDYDDAEVDV